MAETGNLVNGGTFRRLLLRAVPHHVSYQGRGFLPGTPGSVRTVSRRGVRPKPQRNASVSERHQTKLAAPSGADLAERVFQSVHRFRVRRAELPDRAPSVPEYAQGQSASGPADRETVLRHPRDSLRRGAGMGVVPHRGPVLRHGEQAGAAGGGPMSTEAASTQPQSARQLTVYPVTGARSRIEALVDPDSFDEFGSLVRHRATAFGMDQRRPAGDGVITGYARIDGRPVGLFAQDATVLGGS